MLEAGKRDKEAEGGFGKKSCPYDQSQVQAGPLFGFYLMNFLRLNLRSTKYKIQV